MREPASVVPTAIPGPVVNPPRATTDVVTGGATVQDQAAPQHNLNLGGQTLSPNTFTNIYTVPANKTLVVTSVILTGGNSVGQLVAFDDATNSIRLAASYCFGTGPIELCTQGPITVGAGIQIGLGIGSASANIAFKISGYLVDPSTFPAPVPGQLAKTPVLG